MLCLGAAGSRTGCRVHPGSGLEFFEVTESLTDPEISTFLLADAVYRDEKSKKVIVAGIFSKVFADRFPTKHLPGATLFIQAGGSTCGAVEVIFRKEGSTESLLELVIHMSHSPTKPSDLLQMIVPLPVLPLPEAGDYVLEIHGTRLLRSLVVTAEQRPREETK